MELFGHPFSSFTWKALIPLYDTHTPFTFRNIQGDQFPENEAAFRALWPVGKFPLLVDDGMAVMESSIIVEHVAPQFVPADREAAREVRMLDRIFDNHVMAPVQAIVSEHLPFIAETPDPKRIARARAALDTIYPWLDTRLTGREWAAGDDFSLADCAAAPALFYADWAHEIPAAYTNLRTYRARLLARPSGVRCVDDARPYRHFFPLGAPDRD